MTRDEYNKKIQSIQAVWPEDSCRFETFRETVEGPISEARFQVYLDHWRTLGIQRRPFNPDSIYEWSGDEECRVMFHLAGAVSSGHFR
jgi:hypothetical protein